jgi:Tripartite tricarboxylate transporter family receptor
MVAQDLAAAFGVSVIVENRPGATGTIGGGVVARAAPNGETLLGTSIGPQTIAPHLNKLKLRSREGLRADRHAGHRPAHPRGGGEVAIQFGPGYRDGG